MMRTTPERVPHLQTSAPHQWENVSLLRFIYHATDPIHGKSSVESGFGLGVLGSRSRDLIARPPGPHNSSRKRLLKCILDSH
ncbi:hypothetical protein AVEN_23988-1 [Araneus ventricosus]|uniref:Uncharacterized protein n=1 Tax=Araneus ventricosus TaxID=182803 RepID=A0A4Y2D1L8_ARAVE|nr:hypothetical protein AVEN_23988-1 [Araneus ventricosus]